MRDFKNIELPEPPTCHKHAYLLAGIGIGFLIGVIFTITIIGGI